MPLPFIPALVAIGSASLGLLGIKKGADGLAQLKDAKKIGKEAQARHTKAVQSVDRARKTVVSHAADHASLLERVATTTTEDVRRFLNALQKRTKAREVLVPAGVDVGSVSLAEYSQKVLDPPKDLAAVISAAGTGAAASSATVGLVGLLGTASTGAAISGLSGAAATNATLAWLGGGSLAAGGGGMAVGSLVLGGIVAGPALAVTGFAVNSKGEKALTKAHEYAANANKQSATLKTTKAFLKRVNTRIDELGELVDALDERVRAALAVMDVQSFDTQSDQDLRSLQALLQLATALSEVMTTPILDSQGSLTAESEHVLIHYRELVR